MQYEIVRAIDNSDNGTRVAGLTPVVVYAKTLAAGTDVSAHVSISAVANGDYLVAYDAILYGDASIQVDFTGTLPLAADRYKSIVIRGVIDANLTKILGTALPVESVAGRDAAALGKFLDVATPVLTAASVNQTIDAADLPTAEDNFAELQGYSVYIVKSA